jgi:tungstate transport system substrate-binding protein
MRTTLSTLLVTVAILVPMPAAAQFSTVRLATVPSPDETGLLRSLLPDFERESGYRVEVYSGEDVHDVARAGRADLVISHYGHQGTEAFITQGFGLWPRAVFANQIVIIGPADDPARISGLQDPAEAFRRIAERASGSLLVSNNSAVMKYLESILWEEAGHPTKDAWYLDRGLSEQDGMALAADLGAYYIFALPPFLTWRDACTLSAVSQGNIGVRAGTSPRLSPPCNMQPMVLLGMPARIMMSMVVNPQKVAAVNVTGAAALQSYLLRPAVQARIETFRDIRSTLPIWKAAGLHNSPAGLGFGPRP